MRQQRSEEEYARPVLRLYGASGYGRVWCTMSETQAYLAKARENLASATSDMTQQRWNSSVRSAYYACFHAAIAALYHAGVRPPTPERLWGHDQVQALFVGQLIQRHKRYPATLRRMLTDLLAFRHTADYRARSVSQREAQQAVQRAQTFVQAITAQVASAGDTR
jgi:uncharacterized protein (UPF0332 family)